MINRIMTVEESDKEEKDIIPDAKRIKQFALSSARKECDRLEDIGFEFPTEDFTGILSNIETLTRIAKNVDGLDYQLAGDCYSDGNFVGKVIK